MWRLLMGPSGPLHTPAGRGAHGGRSGRYSYLKYVMAGVLLGLVMGMQVSFTSSKSGGNQGFRGRGSPMDAGMLPYSTLTAQAGTGTKSDLNGKRLATSTSTSSSGPAAVSEGGGVKRLSAQEVSWWLDLLGNYTEEATARPSPADDRAGERKVRGAHNPLWNLPVAEGGPVSIKQWVESGRCRHADLYLAQIVDMLEPWSNGGITKPMVETALRLGLERSSFGSLLYQIVGGQVYARSNGNDLYIEMYAGLLVHTLRHLRLPDMEFALHNGKDLPVMQKHEVWPMLAYATGDAFAEVLVPCPWYVLELAKKVLEEREQWKPMARHDFKDKMGRAAWRGSPNDFLGLNQDNYRFAPRFKLVQAARERPDLLDAEITSSLVLIQQAGWEFECFVYTDVWLLSVEGVERCEPSTLSKFRQAQEGKALTSDVVEGKFKYSINLDGTGVSERYASQLAGPTTVLKVESPFYNYYSRFFRPWQHYIPVKYDLSDIHDKLDWANAHEDEAYDIMVRATTFARELFQPDEVTCYTGLLLTAYSRLVGYQTELRPDVARFKQ